MERRNFLRASGGLVSAASMAGCLSRLGFRIRDAGREPPVLEDRPNAVYIPTHVEGMKMAGMAKAGPYRCALTFSFPHRFWLVTGQNRKRVDIQSEDSVHLMVSLWDPETKVVPPVGSVSLDISGPGEPSTVRPWPMLSQNMGFHFGDNVPLSGDGTYDVTVDVGPMQTQRSGGFQGTFGEPASASISFEFSQSALEEIMFKRLEERAGERAAVDPMQMEMMPLAQLPPKADLPGTVVGEATSGDGRFVVTKLDSPPEGIDGSGPYLAVSARTPYSRYPLPFMSLSATVERSGSTVFDGPLTATLDPQLNYHYGASMDALESGDSIMLTVGAPPQVSRHEGYETAFFEMPPMELTVSANQ